MWSYIDRACILYTSNSYLPSLHRKWIKCLIVFGIGCTKKSETRQCVSGGTSYEVDEEVIELLVFIQWLTLTGNKLGKIPCHKLGDDTKKLDFRVERLDTNGCRESTSLSRRTRQGCEHLVDLWHTTFNMSYSNQHLHCPALSFTRAGYFSPRRPLLLVTCTFDRQGAFLSSGNFREQVKVGKRSTCYYRQTDFQLSAQVLLD